MKRTVAALPLMVARWVGPSSGLLFTGALVFGTADLMAEMVSSFSATVAFKALISLASLFSFLVFLRGLVELPFEFGFLPKSLFTFRAAVLIAASSSFSSGDRSLYSSFVWYRTSTPVFGPLVGISDSQSKSNSTVE